MRHFLIPRHQPAPAVRPAAADEERPAPADLALVLAIDASGSVSNERFALQRRGCAAALRDARFLEAVRAGGPYARVAVTVLEWTGEDRQRQTVPWTLIDGPDSAARAAAALLAAPGMTPGYTSISGAIDAAVRLLAACGCAPARRVIDVSGDGVNNDGRPVTAARDDAIEAGITINGLPILGAAAGIEAYYAANVIGGRRAFLSVAQRPESFGEAMLRKLLTEVAGDATRARAGVA